MRDIGACFCYASNGFNEVKNEKNNTGSSSLNISDEMLISRAMAMMSTLLSYFVVQGLHHCFYVLQSFFIDGIYNSKLKMEYLKTIT